MKSLRELLGMKKTPEKFNPSIQVNNTFVEPSSGGSLAPKDEDSELSKTIQKTLLNNMEQILPLKRTKTGLGIFHSSLDKFHIITVGKMKYDISQLSDYLMAPEKIKLAEGVRYSKQPHIPNFFTRCGICMNNLEPIPTGKESDYVLDVNLKNGVNIGTIKVCISCLAKLNMMGKVEEYKSPGKLYGNDYLGYKAKAQEAINKGYITNMTMETSYEGRTKMCLEIIIP